MLITGGTGLLGTDLTAYFKKKFDVKTVGSADCDITDYNQVMEYLVEYQPQVVLHSAAIANVDLCETDKNLANRVNIMGSENIARACGEIKSQLVYYSTDYVFDGNKGTAYNESDVANPINYYGKSKLDGEKKVAEFCENTAILRIAWLYSPNPKAFINKLIKAGQEQIELKKSGKNFEPIKIVSDQFGSPTYTLDIARQTDKIITSGKTGLYHCVAGGAVSRYELARYIFDYLSLPVELNGCSMNDFQWRAPRPKFTALRNNRLEDENINFMRDYESALIDFLGNRA